MIGQKIGYARVSTQTQNLKTQVSKMTACGCVRVFQEQAGSRGPRPEFDRIMSYLREGDTLVITRLDRLARSLADLSAIARQLQEQKIDLVVLDQHIDTTTTTGRVLFGFLAVMAEFELDLITERTREGRDAARKAGVKFGAKPKLTDAQKKEIKELREKKPPMSISDIGKKYKVSPATIYRALAPERYSEPQKQKDGG